MARIVEHLSVAELEARCEACEDVTVKLSVWNAPKEQYSIAIEHRAIERVIEASGLAWTFLRPNGFMQNYLGDAPTHGAPWRCRPSPPGRACQPASKRAAALPSSPVFRQSPAPARQSAA